jgi:hypothetical protein
MTVLLIFQIIRRTGNLTESEKEQRRQATQAKHYSSHKDKILERSKKRRELIADFARRSQQLTVFAESALKQRRNVREKVEDYGKELERVYGNAASFGIEEYMRPYKTPVSYYTVAMLFVYFMPPDSLPSPLIGLNTTGRAIDCIPSDSHYRQLCKLIHPDRHPEFAEYSALANASWQLWKKVLADPGVNDMRTPPNANTMPEQSAEYCRQSDMHAEMSTVVMAYFNCWCHVSNSLAPPKLTPVALHRSLLATAESRELLNASLDDEDTGMRDLEDGIEDVIAQGKKFAALPQSRRKRVPERELEDEIDEDEEEEDEDEVLSGRQHKRLRTVMLDPSLR